MFKKQTLKNGIRLITAPLKETQTASLLVIVKVGSRHESEPIAGLSHFVEHMMFKGTAKRPNTLALSKELDGIGAEYNAFTGKDETAYYIKADAKHLSLAIDMLSDMLKNSKLETEELEREKGVIVEEINMYEDNPLMYAEEMLEEIMFSGNALGRMIAGSRQTVRETTRAKMAAYKKKHYTGKNMVIAVAGKFSDKHLKEIKAKFDFSSGAKSRIDKVSLRPASPRVKLKYKDTEQVQLALGWPAYAYGDARLYPLQLLSVILGGNMSSRLFINVREKKGLAYYVHSGVNVYEDVGSLLIQAGLDKTRIDEAILTILTETEKIKYDVSDEELRRAKDFIAGKIALDLEDSFSIAKWYGQQEVMTGKLLTPSEKMKKLEKVSKREIMKAAGDLFDNKKISLALIGPFKDASRFKKLLK